MVDINPEDLLQLRDASTTVRRVRKDLEESEKRVEEYRLPLYNAETQLDNAIRRVLAAADPPGLGEQSTSG